MTALKLETVACLACDGAGERVAPGREPKTGTAITRDCPTCTGTGVVPADIVATCTVCTGSFWAGDGCDHGVDTLCSECRTGCTDCADETRAAAADADAVFLRIDRSTVDALDGAVR